MNQSQAFRTYSNVNHNYLSQYAIVHFDRYEFCMQSVATQ